MIQEEILILLKCFSVIVETGYGEKHQCRNSL